MTSTEASSTQSDVQPTAFAAPALQQARSTCMPHDPLRTAGSSGKLGATVLQCSAAAQPKPNVQLVIKQPAQAYEYFTHVAEQKQSAHLWRVIWLGILAGFYIGMGYALASVVAGQMPEAFRHDWKGIFNLVYGAIGLPVGLTMVVLTGADLFTSNVCYMTCGLLEGKTGLYALLRSWLVSWFANLLGSLILVWMLLAADIYTSSPMAGQFVLELVYKKTHLSWSAALVRGMLCNFLVCMAVYQAALAQDLTGKFVGIFLPISTFMMLGFEHSIANEFILSMGYALQGLPTCTEATPGSLLEVNPAACSVSIGRIIGSNLIPVTIGNIIGGGVLVAIALGVPLGRFGATTDKLHTKYLSFCKNAAWKTWPAKNSPELPV